MSTETQCRGEGDLAAETEALRKEVSILRGIVAKEPQLYKAYFEKEVTDALRQTLLFQSCSEDDLLLIGRCMKRAIRPKGFVLHEEGMPATELIVLVEGEFRRTRKIDGVLHGIQSDLCERSVGAFHIMQGTPTFGTSTCVTDCVLYTLPRADFIEIVMKNPQLSCKLMEHLCQLLRRSRREVRTALFEQQAPPASIPITSAAAFVESFYRSAMNAWLNARLMGTPVASYFPNMHIQSSIRVCYINGFKQLRTLFDSIKVDGYTYPGLARLAFACGPGVIMTPVSSLLEANNAGHSNPEPLQTRWIRGIVPRCCREVIFGIGINQLSDYCQERVPRSITHKPSRNALGSLSAGVICAYLSHVPHNLSAMKLLKPEASYGELWEKLVTERQNKLNCNKYLASAAAILAPKGLHIRAGQVMGSFCIINGLIAFLQGQEAKMKKTSEVSQSLDS